MGVAKEWDKNLRGQLSAEFKKAKMPHQKGDLSKEFKKADLKGEFSKVLPKKESEKGKAVSQAPAKEKAAAILEKQSKTEKAHKEHLAAKMKYDFTKAANGRNK